MMSQHSDVTATPTGSQIAAELQSSKALFARNNWPMIDVTRRSVEETAAQIIKLLQDRDAADQEPAGDGRWLREISFWRRAAGSGGKCWSGRG